MPLTLTRIIILNKNESQQRISCLFTHQKDSFKTRQKENIWEKINFLKSMKYLNHYLISYAYTIFVNSHAHKHKNNLPELSYYVCVHKCITQRGIKRRIRHLFLCISWYWTFKWLHFPKFRKCHHHWNIKK